MLTFANNLAAVPCFKGSKAHQMLKSARFCETEDVEDRGVKAVHINPKIHSTIKGNGDTEQTTHNTNYSVTFDGAAANLFH